MIIGSNEDPINLLDSGVPEFIHRLEIYDKPKYGIELKKILSKYGKEFGSNINVFTRPFSNAYEKARPSISTSFNELKVKLIGQQKGVIIKYCHVEGREGKLTLFYDFSLNYEGKSGNPWLRLVAFFNTMPLFILDDDVEYCYQSTTDGRMLSWIIQDLTYMVTFLKYCDLQVKELEPKNKCKIVDCKYLNNTNRKINILDSKWFTTLVKSDAFKVRGHFRLQPCGEGMKDRKLIWINDFEKSGYTAPARKLSKDI